MLWHTCKMRPSLLSKENGDRCSGDLRGNKTTVEMSKVHRQPAEVFRTDFITAMKIPDSQVLAPGEFINLSDPWRQEWERGVQVPILPEKVLAPIVRLRDVDQVSSKSSAKFELPSRLIVFDREKYVASLDRSSTNCDYDLDEMDMEWLRALQSLRLPRKALEIDEMCLERAITYFERQCFETMAHAVKTKEGLSIEYDETTTCMICLSPDAEDGNEIVFCDACNMCVHQHCYGVLDIPDGIWLCNPCSRGVLSPPCCLCPNQGGALKRMKDSAEWIHVICAWWVPEVKIEDAKYIERITKDRIPSSRWSLTCEVCREKMGACIQCSVKRCVRAYHVTCAVKAGFEMKTVFMHDKDDVQHISFCSKHCDPSPREGNHHLKRGLDAENNRLKELRKLESEFHKLIDVSKAARALRVSKESARRLHAYWTMKRRVSECAPIIPLTIEQQEQLSGKQGVVFINQQRTLEMERFLLLRQDLERLRNLCYMIVRREKMRRELHRVSVDLFYKREEILIDYSASRDDIDFVSRTTDNMRFLRFSNYYRTETALEDELGFKLTLDDSQGEETLSLFDKIRLFGRHDYVGPSRRTGLGDVACRPHGERNIFERLFAPTCMKGLLSASVNSAKSESSSPKPAASNFVTDDESDLDVESEKQSCRDSPEISCTPTKNSPRPPHGEISYFTSIADTIKFKLSKLRRRSQGLVDASDKSPGKQKVAKSGPTSVKTNVKSKDSAPAKADLSVKRVLENGYGPLSGPLRRGKKRLRSSDKTGDGNAGVRTRSCSVELRHADRVNLSINLDHLPVVFDRLASPVRKKPSLKSDVSDDEPVARPSFQRATRSRLSLGS